MPRVVSIAQTVVEPVHRLIRRPKVQLVALRQHNHLPHIKRGALPYKISLARSPPGRSHVSACVMSSLLMLWYLTAWTATLYTLLVNSTMMECVHLFSWKTTWKLHEWVQSWTLHSWQRQIGHGWKASQGANPSRHPPCAACPRWLLWAGEWMPRWCDPAR